MCGAVSVLDGANRMSGTDQNEIWRFFQGEGSTSFEDADGRARFLARQVSAGENVLNIGVGGALFERHAAARGVVVFVLDPDESAVAAVREKLSLGERAKTGLADAIPFAAATIDVVVMSEVLEHLTDEILLASLKEVFRVLRPGGRFLITVPHVENLVQNEVVCPHCRSRFHRWGHHQSFTVARITEVLEKCGFRVRRRIVRTFPNWRQHGMRRFIKSLLSALAGRLGVVSASPVIYVEALRLEEGGVDAG